MTEPLNDPLNATLGVFSYKKDGNQIGTIELRDGKMRGSTSGIQSIIESRLRFYEGNAQKAWDSLQNWSNGYLWTKEV